MFKIQGYFRILKRNIKFWDFFLLWIFSTIIKKRPAVQQKKILFFFDYFNFNLSVFEKASLCRVFQWSRNHALNVSKKNFCVGKILKTICYCVLYSYPPRRRYYKGNTSLERVCLYLSFVNITNYKKLHTNVSMIIKKAADKQKKSELLCFIFLKNEFIQSFSV